MNFSRKKIKQICGLLVLAALLFWAVSHSSQVSGGVSLFFEIISPFAVGGAIAFVLNLPMRAIEEKLMKKWQGKVAGKCKRSLSMLLSVIFLVLIITLVVSAVVPQISRTVTQLGRSIPVFLKDVSAWVEELAKDYPELGLQDITISELKLDWEKVVNTVVTFLKSGVVSVLSSTFSVAGTIAGGVVNGVISLIFALYLLAQKEKLADQGRRILMAYCPEKTRGRILKVLTMLNRNFRSFIVGQCLEALILGTLFVVIMSLVGMPYAFMIGVLIAFTALIPIVGAFVGCAVGAFLILMVNPVKALWFVILFLVLQQLEGNLIYPKVVGNSVGLPSIWVLVAVTLGGSLFGITGILLFIPLFATGYALLREDVNARNGKKEVIKAEDETRAAGAGENIEKTK